MFSKYRKLNEKDSIKYIKEKMDIFGENEDLISREIGDGNINYIYKISSKESRFSVIVKQADKILRSSGRELDTDRIRIEAEALMLEGDLAPGMTPKIYLYDEIMHCIIMEDLSDYKVMRESLIEGKSSNNFGENISDFLVNTTLPTTDLVMNQIKKKKMVKNFINPELCDISERLVFTDPFKDIPENSFHKTNKNLIHSSLYKNYDLHLEVEKLRNEFMTNAQALIHGDLHTGSIFVKDYKIKVIDSEFAFYGPIGYDLGSIIGNLFLAKLRNIVSNKESDKYSQWLTQTIESTVDLFKVKFLKFLEKNDKSNTKEFQIWYLEQVMNYGAGTTGLEIIRRIVGEAKVADIETIENPVLKINAERVGVFFAKECIMKRKNIRSGKDYLDLFFEKIEEAV